MTAGSKVIVITGASRGIGEAAALHLADAGHKVVLAARSAVSLKQIADEIGENALGVSCDVSDYDQVKAMVDQTIAHFGRLDVIVNNAGLLEPIHRLTDFEPSDWDKVIDVNVKGVFYAMHAVLPVMEEQGDGVIINISSGAAYNALEGWSHYCASKAAVLQLTRSGHNEHGPKIKVVGLSPGTVATEMQVNIKDSGLNPVSNLEWSDHIPPSDVAKAIEYLMNGGAKHHMGADFSLKTPEGRTEAGLAPRC